MLAGTNEFDRDAGDLPDRQQRTTTGVAVEFGHDQAVEFESIVECSGTADRILTGHAIDHEEHLIGLDSVVDSLELSHQLFIDRQSAGGIEDEYGDIFLFGFFDRFLAHLHRILFARFAEDRHTQLLADNVQLLDGSGSLQVGGAQHDRLFALHQQRAELAAGGGLTTTLQTAEHEDVESGLELDRRFGRSAEERNQLISNNTNDLLRWVEC